MVRYRLTVFQLNPDTAGDSGESEYIFDTLRDAQQAQELLKWLDPEPCVGSNIDEVEVKDASLR